MKLSYRVLYKLLDSVVLSAVCLVFEDTDETHKESRMLSENSINSSVSGRCAQLRMRSLMGGTHKYACARTKQHMPETETRIRMYACLDTAPHMLGW